MKKGYSPLTMFDYTQLVLRIRAQIDFCKSFADYTPSTDPLLEMEARYSQPAGPTLCVPVEARLHALIPEANLLFWQLEPAVRKNLETFDWEPLIAAMEHDLRQVNQRSWQLQELAVARNVARAL